MGWASLANNVSLEPIILYLSAIFWTLGYDTIYGIQDIHDDEIIGIKSTSIKFKNNVKFFVGTCYSLCVFFILIIFFMMEINKYLSLMMIPFIATFIYQLKIVKYSKDNFDQDSCCIMFYDFEEGQDVIQLPCKHIFDPEGIKTWLKEEQAKCPICRFELDSKEVKDEDSEEEIPLVENEDSSSNTVDIDHQYNQLFHNIGFNLI